MFNSKKIEFLEMKPRTKNFMLIFADEFKFQLTYDMKKFFDGLINEGSLYQEPTDEQFVSFYKVRDKLVEAAHETV